MSFQKIITIASLLITLYCLLIYSFRSVHPKKDFSVEAQMGYLVWQKNKCFACHKIYGLGGFIAPDLTSITQRLDQKTFEHIIKKGTRNMPRYSLTKKEINHLYSFFETLADENK